MATKKSNSDIKSATKKVAAKKTVKKKISTKKRAPAKSSVAKKAIKEAASKAAQKERRTSDKVLPSLLENLQGVFDKIYQDNRHQDEAHDQLAKELTTHLSRSYEGMSKQLEKREKLLDRKLKTIDRTHENDLKRVKWMSIPVTLISLVAITYLFYVVSVMESAMSSMSADMRHMTGYIKTITVDTSALSKNTGDMTREISAMRTDVYHMSRTVSPAMHSINKFMP